MTERLGKETMVSMAQFRERGKGRGRRTHGEGRVAEEMDIDSGRTMSASRTISTHKGDENKQGERANAACVIEEDGVGCDANGDERWRR